MEKAANRNMAHALMITPEMVEDFSRIVRSADELRILAELVHSAFGSHERRSSNAESVSDVLRTCFGVDYALQRIHVLQDLIDRNIVTVEQRRFDSNVSTSHIRGLLDLHITVSDYALGLLLELEQECNAAREDEPQQEIEASEVFDLNSVIAEEEEDPEDRMAQIHRAMFGPSRKDEPEDEPDADGKRAVLREESVSDTMLYIPDTSIAEAFEEIRSICQSDVSATLREYGVASIASHYEPAKHERTVVLLHGAPGTGKTAAAYALAHGLKRRLFVTSVDAMKSPYQGEFERNTRRMFEEFREIAVACDEAPILLIDECESLFAKRTEELGSGNRSHNGVVDILLQEMEKFEGILVLTTNTSEVFDDAFARRIDYTLTLSGTSKETQREIWKHRLPAGFPGAETVDIEALVERHDLTPAEITLIMRRTLRALVSADPVSHRLTHEILDAACANYHQGHLMLSNGVTPHRKEPTVPFGFY
jgi:SpoVK/Ycf46/Vps4 family AAA+-type ATPase